MSDERLRELERRWRETGTIDDDEAYLLEKIRAGILSEEMLKLAAFCGNLASRKILKNDYPKAADFDPYFWISKLEIWGKEIWVRAAIASSVYTLEHFETLNPTDQRPRLAIQAAINWLFCPCADNQRAAENTAAAAHTSSENPLNEEDSVIHQRALADQHAAEEVFVLTEDYFDDAFEVLKEARARFKSINDRFKPAALCARSARNLALAITNEQHLSWRAAEEAIISADKAAIYMVGTSDDEISIKKVVQDALIPWALGYSDPVLELEGYDFET